ncbi:hypothetical protein BD289DRAFT_443063 [Coniella lustricola]|uniref:HNH domain-containing protein n=1 Tax=Coniella lustricola TaxID=2025994 RepID=A0A2T2ZXM5_9PEZI|nr:hypothetical protein BD289DRAFT_443063 [Coniella lustricola]
MHLPDKSSDNNDTLTHNFDLFRDAFSAALIERVSFDNPQQPSSKPSHRSTNKKKKTGTTATHRKSTARNNNAALPDQENHATTSNSSGADTSTTTAANNAEDLADFADYTAQLAFASLPRELQTLAYTTWADNVAHFGARYHLDAATTTAANSGDAATPATNTTLDNNEAPAPSIDPAEIDISSSPGLSTILSTLDPEVSESLLTYNFLRPPASTSLSSFITPVLTTYLSTILTTTTSSSSSTPSTSTTVTTVTTATSKKPLPTSCELCDRDWIPLTNHHLIPRAVHAKALKRHWHPAAHLQNAAWLCRACHSFVHRFASNEELARDWFTVERLLEAEEVRAFAKWVSRIRWKAR